jgi:hypothetical protein
MGEMINGYKILVSNHKRNRPLGRHRHEWEGNITMDLKEMGLEGVTWIHLTQDRDDLRALVNTVMNLHVPQKVGNFLTS